MDFEQFGVKVLTCGTISSILTATISFIVIGAYPVESKVVYFSQAEAARRLKISESTLWRWLKAGTIEPSALLDGKVPIFSPLYLDTISSKRKLQTA